VVAEAEEVGDALRAIGLASREPRSRLVNDGLQRTTFSEAWRSNTREYVRFHLWSATIPELSRGSAEGVARPVLHPETMPSLRAWSAVSISLMLSGGGFLRSSGLT